MTVLKIEHDFNKIISDLLLRELLLLPSETRIEITSEVSEELDYDLYSIIYTDAHDDIADYLSSKASSDLMHLIRRCMYKAGKALVEQYDEHQSLCDLLNYGIRKGIDTMLPYVSKDDIDNERIMSGPLDLNVIFVGILTEVLDKTPAEAFDDTSGSAD